MNKFVWRKIFIPVCGIYMILMVGIGIDKYLSGEPIGSDYWWNFVLFVCLIPTVFILPKE